VCTRAHRWGEPVFEFAMCIKQHGRDRFWENDADELGDMPYWVCAVREPTIERHAGAQHTVTRLRSRAVGAALGFA
jgi:hypothetical protein